MNERSDEMRSILVMVIFASWAIGCSSKKSGQLISVDEPQLQGSWTVISMQESGLSISTNEKMTMKFDEDRLITNLDSRDERSKFSVDLTTTPRQIDITDDLDASDGNQGGNSTRVDARARLGIYEIKDDRLTICIPSSKDTPRPTSVSPDDRSGITIYVLKRVK